MFGSMKLLQRVRDVGLCRRLAKSTIECYQSWIGEFLRFSRVPGRWRPPQELHAADVERFLTHLARDRRVSASTQNQALCAIVFLYQRVLIDELGTDHLGRFAAERARRPTRIPTVLSAAEVQKILSVLAVRACYSLSTPRDGTESAQMLGATAPIGS